MKIKPKSFGPIFVFYQSSGNIQFAIGEPMSKTDHPPYDTPVDTMIASLGACIVKSMIWSADQKKVRTQ